MALPKYDDFMLPLLKLCAEVVLKSWTGGRRF